LAIKNRKQKEMETNEYLLKLISSEIEEKWDCKVISIRYAELLSLCVRFKVEFNEDLLYKPFSGLATPDYIIFSEKSASFTKRVDLFDCVKKYSKSN
jgi:hypothetical protein